MKLVKMSLSLRLLRDDWHLLFFLLVSATTLRIRVGTRSEQYKSARVSDGCVKSGRARDIF